MDLIKRAINIARKHANSEAVDSYDIRPEVGAAAREHLEKALSTYSAEWGRLTMA